jgi:hypothetical protein
VRSENELGKGTSSGTRRKARDRLQLAIFCQDLAQECTSAKLMPPKG